MQIFEQHDASADTHAVLSALKVVQRKAIQSTSDRGRRARTRERHSVRESVFDMASPPQLLDAELAYH